MLSRAPARKPAAAASQRKPVAATSAAARRAAAAAAAAAQNSNVDSDDESTDESDEDDDLEDGVIHEEEELAQAFKAGLLRADAAVPQRPKINNEERLRERLGDIAQQVDANFPWAERLDLVSTVPIVLDDAQDDFKREMSFYNQALEAVKLARPRLAAANIKFTRPDDYFAEMVKTDDHMRKVREALLSEHQAVERSEQAKKSRQMKQFGKKVQQQVLEDRQKQKTSDLEAIKKFKKDRSAKPDFLDDGDDQFNIGVDKEESHSQKTNSKRSYKNDKYGNGGKKRGSKRNTRDSASDDSSFNFARNKALPKGFKSAGVAKKFGGGAGGKSKAPRPGKSRRRSAKSRQ